MVLEAVRSLSRTAILSMIEEMKPLQVVAMKKMDWLGGGQVLRQFSDQNLTLTDAVGLWLMEQRSLKACWSTDFHLGLTGVPLAIHAV